MKLITLTIAACMCLSAARAQVNYHPSPLADMIRLVQHMNASNNEPSSKTTATKQRLIGSATIDAQMQITDSIVYRYSSGRGSEYDMDRLSFSKELSYPVLYNEKMVMFDSMHNSITMESSSIEYAVADRPLTQTYYSQGITLRRMNWAYDSQNQVASYTTENYINATKVWKPTYRMSFTFNASGKMIFFETETYGSGWQLMFRSDFFYNSSGLVDSVVSSNYSGGQWVARFRNRFTYTGTNLVSSVQEEYLFGSWQNDDKIETVYSGNKKASEIYYDWDGSNWTLLSEEYRHLNGNLVPDSVFYRKFRGVAGWDTTICKFVFNSFENPVSVDSFGGSMNFVEHTRFTYQDYDPQDVKEIAVAKTLTVYPNPAKDQLHVATSDMKHGNINYTVTNALGQSVLMGSNKHGSGEMTVDIHPLSPGMYWLQLWDERGEAYRAAFSKAE